MRFKTIFDHRQDANRRSPVANAFSLIETLVSMAIAGVVIGGIIVGFVQSARQAETSSYVLAAQAMASEGLEQVRAAKWDPSASPPVDQVTNSNFPTISATLDVVGGGRSVIRATNITTITTISTNPPLRMIRVDCVWRFLNAPLTTNSISTYRAPDQ
jgi:prepilin-type N-terminal cleavage/methylation domain-containing protein